MIIKTILSSLIILTAFSGAGQDISVSSRNGSQRISINHGGFSNFNVETRGKIELTDDDKDIKSMSPDGYLEINKTVFGTRRSIVITPQGNGLKREYYEGRTLVAFEPEGRKWLAEILPELVRSTTIGAESRVNRLYRNGGTKSVLDEIRIIESDYVKAHYANVLMSLPVPEKDYATITRGVSETLDSDHYLAEFLKKNIDKFMKSREAMQGVFAATQKMESDHYMTEVIKEALQSGPATLDGIKIILDATGKMESDHYKTEVLSAILKQSNLTDPILTEILAATMSMESDHYRTVVLNKALSKQGLSATSFQKAVQSVQEIESDHYKTEVLKNLMEKDLPPEVQSQLIDAAASIESDHYFTVVATDLFRRQNVNDAVFQKLLDALGNHDSDHYAATFLQSALERPNISKQNIATILSATGKMDSDHYIAEVLADAAPRIKELNDPALKEAYRAAAKRIESETYYGRALRAID